MFTRPVRTLFCALVIGLITACGNPARQTPAPVTLRISGATSMHACLEDLANAYRERAPHVRFEVLDGGSTIGLSELANGDDVEIAAVSWLAVNHPTPATLAAIPVGRDALAIIVHPRNLAPGLTTLQLRAIYRGEILGWDAVGGPAIEPLIISREDGSGTRAAFETLVMGGDRITLNALVMPSSQAVVFYVASHPEAIGYVSMAALSEQVRPLPIEGRMPAEEDVRDGAYHLTRVLYLVTSSPASDEAQVFLDFVLSPSGQAIVNRHHVALR